MAETPATTRSQTGRKAAAADRSTAARKAVATRARNKAAVASSSSPAAKPAAETQREAARGPVERYAGYAGKAVAIPVGAALVARDNLVATAARYSSLGKVEREMRVRRRRMDAELRRVERRGETARARVARELRESRTRRDLSAVGRGVAAFVGRD
jgi:hypothetical protein